VQARGLRRGEEKSIPNSNQGNGVISLCLIPYSDIQYDKGRKSDVPQLAMTQVIHPLIFTKWVRDFQFRYQNLPPPPIPHHPPKSYNNNNKPKFMYMYTVPSLSIEIINASIIDYIDIFNK